MNLFPSENEFVALSKQGNLIPVYTDLMADYETPVSAYSKIRGKQPAFLFESIVGGEHISRYSFAGCNPLVTFKSYPEKTQILHRDGTVEEVPTPKDPLSLVEKAMARYRPVELPGMPPFFGGAVGFLAHEYIHHIEPTVPRAAKDELGVPVLFYAIMDTVIIFDHVKQILRICSNAYIDENSTPEEAYQTAVHNVKTVFETLQTGRELAPLPLAPIPHNIPPPEGNFTRERFEKMVNDCKEYIRAGDAIQIVASQRFESEYKRDPLDLYRALRIVNPSPYMVVYETPEFSIVGASPEVHVRATHGRVEIRPIAGTRPRGGSEEEDEAMEKELLADPKERAEHLMLVDLARNDIGRVCEIGSVHVKEYAVVERYSHVMHIVSQVEGKLDASKNAYDLMRATFPAGTLTGAPKIRAMQIISEQEKTCRGVYGGALGYFGYQGNLDCCIAIRTALLKNGRIYIQSGAGLVADSVPENEYMETVNKARGMFKAVALSEHISGLKSS